MIPLKVVRWEVFELVRNCVDVSTDVISNHVQVIVVAWNKKNQIIHAITSFEKSKWKLTNWRLLTADSKLTG